MLGLMALMPICVNYYILLASIAVRRKAVYAQALAEELARKCAAVDSVS